MKRQAGHPGQSYSKPSGTAFIRTVEGISYGGVQGASAGIESVAGAQYLTPASMLLLLRKPPLQAQNLRVQLSLKATQLRHQAGLIPRYYSVGTQEWHTTTHAEFWNYISPFNPKRLRRDSEMFYFIVCCRRSPQWKGTLVSQIGFLEIKSSGKEEENTPSIYLDLTCSWSLPGRKSPSVQK